jgi:hypothetical protein
MPKPIIAAAAPAVDRNETDANLLRELANGAQSVGAPEYLEALTRIANRLESDAKRDADYDKLQDIGKTAFESIAEMVAALECDYDRLEELREFSKLDPTDDHCADDLLTVEDQQDLIDLAKAAGDCESREDAEQRIHEDPLSIELSGTWSIGDTPTADKAIILLGTGGPAVRIVCELDGDEPRRAWLETQDWFQPWTEYRGGDSETLLTYCRCFYFGEG